MRGRHGCPITPATALTQSKESTMPKAALKTITNRVDETLPENPGAIMLPAAVLRQDAVIIDEQENHIVLTVRVPLDWIRDNHATLMALCEIATGKPAEPDDDDAPAPEAADA
jgi:hypothetical protein